MSDNRAGYTVDKQATTNAQPSRTGMALRVFFRALASDLSRIWHRVTRPRPTSTEASLRKARRGLSLQLFKGIAALLILGLLILSGAMLWALNGLPLDDRIAKGQEREILLEANSGAPLGRVGPLEISNASREEFPPVLVNAVLSTEDRHFYRHWGVDVIGIARAALRNYDAGTIVEGGSTITQQLVKLRLLRNERTYGRKLREALAAFWLEMRLSKDEILTRYLNSVYMGAGAQGIPAAARLYFNKRPADLTVPEAALLAGLIKAPSRFNPLRDVDAAHERAAAVLDAMAANGVIDQKSAADAKAHPAALSQPHTETENATWFSDWVAQEAQDVTGSFTGTMRVRTTLDPELQSTAQQVLDEALKENASRHVTQGALVAMRPDGAVLAMVGGRNYHESQFNRAVQAQRQPGSAFSQRGYASVDDLWAKLEGYFSVRAEARAETREKPELPDWAMGEVSAERVSAALAPTRFEDFGSTPSENHHQRAILDTLESAPPNNIHNAVGGGPGFMSELLAPVDPIFWLHHANIDRLWDLWTTREQRAERTALPEDTARWNKEPFLFFTPGESLSERYVDTGELGYRYSEGFGAEMLREGPSAEVSQAATPSSRAAKFESEQGHAPLRTDAEASAAVRVPSDLLAAARMPKKKGGTHSAAAGGQAQPELVAQVSLRPSQDHRAVRVLFYLNCSDLSPETTLTDPHYVGSVTFFGVHGTGHHTAQFTVTLPLNDTLQRLAAAGERAA